jgi:glutamate N-acetyltransferase / amino-acid N-acetyltransferase
VESYASEAEYIRALELRSALPAGFRCAVRPLTFQPRERTVPAPLPMNLSLVLMDRPTPDFGAVFTRNQFPGAPVIMGRQRLDQPAVRGILVNTKISNVGTPGGVEDASALLGTLAALLDAQPGEFFPSSTGIIGWSLPVAAMAAELPALVGGLQGGTILPLARGIMTTDSFPKVRRAAVGAGSIVGVAKGAGMIEPNMATMLCFLLTDLVVPRAELRAHLAWCVDRTLNRMTVDSDQSTSDTAIILSSGARGPAEPAAFRAGLLSVLEGLALDIVRNAEGAGHAVRVNVQGAPDEAAALGVARAVANSPLVKTAVFGNDPNVGRILCAVGDWMGNNGLVLDRSRLQVTLGGEQIFRAGAFCLDAAREDRLNAYLKERAFESKRRAFPAHDRTVDVDISLGGPSGPVAVLGTDLSYEYVRENADYRS